jgi:hypothetical protein
MNMTLFKIWEYLKDHWKCIVTGILAGLVVVAIVFALPLVTISTETTETDYTTEFRQEAYAVNEPYIAREVTGKMEVIASGLYKVVPSGVVIPFYVEKPDTWLVGNFQNTIPGSFTIFSDTNRVIWETFGSVSVINLPLPTGSYQARFRENIMWAEDCYIHLAKKWTEVEQVTKYQEVIRYRQVPVKVERQKTFIKQEKISIWKHLFS